MAVKYQYRFTVTATKSRFPVDMLRYDRATPARENDSGLIAAAINREVDAPVIELCSEREPTTGRWASFGWSIVKVEKVRL